MDICGIIVAAGAGRRLGADRNKTLLPLGGQPLFLYAVKALRPFCSHLILVVQEAERAAFKRALAEHHVAVDAIAQGGRERRHSVENALGLVPEGAQVVLVHDAARPFPAPQMIEAVILAATADGAAIPALPVSDTLRRDEGGSTVPFPREGLHSVQTPQGFLRELLLKAYRASDEAASDDAGLVSRLGHPVTLVAGDARNIKITQQEDLVMAEGMLAGGVRVGTGFDTHRLVPGRDLVLGGVTIPHPTGLLGHSDADAALHALMDALLGACALGDIGRHFPDSDPQYKGASSLKLLEQTGRILRKQGFEPWQCDLTIIAQQPKLAPYMEQMRVHIAAALQVPLSRVSVKASTTEGLGFEGRGEGISAQASALVRTLS